MQHKMKERLLKKMKEVINQGPFTNTWSSLQNYQIPQWYQQAKFGIFIHWGVYSVPAFANEWYPRNMYRQGSREYEHHLATYGPHKDFGYKDFIPMFKAEKFVPEDWLDLFKKAGSRFIVPVAEHHDGFQMYASNLSSWNAVVRGPRRDVIGKLALAARKYGLFFGLSSHRAEHWWYFDEGMNFDSDVQDPEYRDFYGPANPAPSDLMNRKDSAPDREFLEDWLARSIELVEKYKPEIVYFDWWIQNTAFEPCLKDFAAYYYNRAASWNKEVVINYKYEAFPEGTAVYDVERGQLNHIRPLFWQTCTSLSTKSWCNIRDNEYKTAKTIICDLVDIVSKNGALLLNVGPRADGNIPDKEQEILLKIGEWLKVNGEAIYGTEPWKSFGEGPTEIKEGAFNDTERKPFTPEDIRFTSKGNILYAIIMEPPETNTIKIKSLARGGKYYSSSIKDIELLGEGKVINWDHNSKSLIVNLQGFEGREYPFVLKIH